MKTFFFTSVEIKNLKEILSHSDDCLAQKLLLKVEKADACETKYLDVTFQVCVEAHREVVAYFEKYKIRGMDIESQVCRLGKGWLRCVSIDDNYIVAQCYDDDVIYDLSYSDALFPLIYYLRYQEKKCK